MCRLLSITLLLVATFCSSLTYAQEVVFEDRFEGTLQPGWFWMRENTGARRIVNNALDILTEPFSGGEARNALVRPLNFFNWQNDRFESSYRIETECSFVGKPKAQHQQCGVYWIRNDRVIFKLVFENIDGRTYVFPGKTPVSSPGGRLRLTVTGQKVIAEFCGQDDPSFRKVYEGRMNCQPNDKISLQCWNGPQGNGQEQWARFLYFRVERLD